MEQNKLFEDEISEEEDEALVFKDIFDSTLKMRVVVIDEEKPMVVEEINGGKVYELEEPIKGVFKIKGTNFKRDTRNFIKRNPMPKTPSLYSKLNIIPEKITNGKQGEKKGQTYFG